MALINGVYVHVTDENVNNDIESTAHPVEKGIDLTDHIRVRPFTLSITGKIVDVGEVKAPTILSKIKSFQRSGALITYSGRNFNENLQIQSFNTSHPNTIAGGCDFDMELKQVRIAQEAYKAPVKVAPEKETVKPNAATAVIKVGSIVVFKGGGVYVSSDAKKPAANRGRSTCKVTIMAGNAHPWHLISTDNGKVYGWVDKANVEGVASNSAAPKQTVGTQQIQQNSDKKVYHTVKSGETVYGLVTSTYKSLGSSSQWVIDNNPTAFSKKGDPKTLKIGAKLWVGNRA